MRTAFSVMLLVAMPLGAVACSVEVGAPSAPAAAPEDVKGATAAEGTAPRPIPESARSSALLAGEIAVLEKRLAEMPPDAPDRPALVRELADESADLEGAAFRETMQASVARDAKKEADAAALQRQARAAAIRYFGLSIHDYPNDPRLDAALYGLAYEYEQADDVTHERKAYYDLIQRRPDSKFVPRAYLAFAELFFKEAATDPSKWALAVQAYGKVTEYPPPRNESYGYAWYKLAYTYWNTGDFAHALAAFKKTIDFGSSFPDLPNATRLAESARRDVVPVYALAGDPTRAYAFFRELSADRSEPDTLDLMAALGRTYLDTGHYAEALALYEDLLARAPRADVTDALGRLASSAQGSGDAATAEKARALLRR